MFIEKQQLNQPDTGILVSRIVTDATTVSVGKAVLVTSGFATPLLAASTEVFGIVVAIVNEDGTPVLTDGTSGAAIGSFTDTYLTAATNETVEKVKVKVNISKETIYAADLDAAAGTTPGSDFADINFDVIDDATIDESDIIGSQFHSHGIDSDGKALVSIYTSQVYK